MKRAYIAGPMRGYENLNFDSFNHLAGFLRKAFPPVEFVNPAELDGGEQDLEWSYCMKRDLKEVIGCDTIFLLPGWSNSRGAQLEAETAKACGLAGWRVFRPFGDDSCYKFQFEFGKRPKPEDPMGNLAFGAVTIVDASGQYDVPRDPRPSIAGAVLTALSGGGTKHDGDKTRMDLVPVGALREWAEVLTFGAKKYEPYNWAKGIVFSRCYAAMLRHMIAWWNQEDDDPETKLSHLAHAMCNIGFLLEYTLQYEEYKGFDDRPRKGGPNVESQDPKPDGVVKKP
jgi:hypothetical protein